MDTLYYSYKKNGYFNRLYEQFVSVKNTFTVANAHHTRLVFVFKEKNL